ncbi:tetratricopeptide repeat protein [Candidatus Acetothermia bacterium]|nr:tetratricopeptide repeat protein [Candidatus Acetothermia bacterium]
MAAKKREDFSQYVKQAKALYQQGKLVECEELLQNLVSQGSADAEVYYYLGLVEYSRSNFGSAEGHFKKSLEMKPNNANACYYVGEICEKLNKMKEARDYYTEALFHQSDHAGAKTRLRSMEVRTETQVAQVGKVLPSRPGVIIGRVARLTEEKLRGGIVLYKHFTLVDRINEAGDPLPPVSIRLSHAHWSQVVGSPLFNSLVGPLSNGDIVAVYVRWFRPGKVIEAKAVYNITCSTTSGSIKKVLPPPDKIR